MEFAGYIYVILNSERLSSPADILCSCVFKVCPVVSSVVRNLHLLVEVTGTEDFAALEDTQRNLASGALDQVIYGKIEAPLSHFHSEVNKAIGLSGA